jgi:hypothetical protein
MNDFEEKQIKVRKSTTAGVIRKTMCFYFNMMR